MCRITWRETGHPGFAKNGRAFLRRMLKLMPTPSHSKLYDTIGNNYHRQRVPDARIANVIRLALGDVRTLCNIGAGAGSYEPSDLEVVAVEPSSKMIKQRTGTFPVVQATAEQLPFSEQSFDCSMAILTIHHWVNPILGLKEMRRVANKQVIFTFDPAMVGDFWLLRDYFPQFIEFDQNRSVPISTIQENLNIHSIKTVPVPWDCTDGFQAAYWRRPEFYLLPNVRNSISTFAQMPKSAVEQGISALANDIETGSWHRRYANLLNKTEMDFGYRLIIGQNESE